MMDRKANLPFPPPPLRSTEDKQKSGVDCNITSTTTSSSSSTPRSPPDLVRQVQAAFKRHRPLENSEIFCDEFPGTMQTRNLMPRRSVFLPRREVSRSVESDAGPSVDTKKSSVVVPPTHSRPGTDHIGLSKNTGVFSGDNQEDASITPPSLPGTITNSFYETSNPYNSQSDQLKPADGGKESHMEFHHVENQKKVQFSVGTNTSFQGADDQMATGVENLSSHMHSLALTEMDCDASNQAGSSAIINPDINGKKFQNMDSEASLRSDGAASSLLAKRTMAVREQLGQFKHFLSQPITQSSVVGSTCATTTSVHSTSAPILNSTTYLSHGNQDGASHPQPPTQSGLLTDQAVNKEIEMKDSNVLLEKHGPLAKECEIPKGSSKENKSAGGEIAGDVKSEPTNLPSDMKPEPPKSENPEKQAKSISSKGMAVSRKRNYDPDVFFKVNGKLYQRLGKIGSGGSSEVHKVISADCSIYALKKIKLKGRDYATAFGFCQEIEYLNRLKGKDHIIQLIDYEVTDKALLREVLSGSMKNKDGRVKDDGYIYMVLEYGEIDLAHMLSQKWKQMEDTDQTIDENWLRFYWQQILLAVNTIHEERIVHSDLKPANFLLVKGSLKLIDFGIAKAIMSDTTNIQRDAQVGTLSYMSPEAFMCNESDEHGNIVKCGRPSDIWSLGCILYQMVYGRTPFSEYKTFWAKFKVITDPNHEIVYEPLSNPCLIDLMKKCLAWDRNERWRIPQLLQHPFLNPPVSPQQTSSLGQSCKLLQHFAEVYGGDQIASTVCSQLQQLLTNPTHSYSRHEDCKLLSEMTNLCHQLQERIANSRQE